MDASLRARFRTTTTTLVLGGHTIEMLHPANSDELIDPAAYDRDERLPYWADLWPSAQVLGEHLLREVGAGRRLLELGCGAGLVAVCAAHAGYDVTASDYYDDALDFTRANVLHNTGRSIATRSLDWRALPPCLDQYDRVVGSDLLYERPYGPQIARAIQASLAPGGMATMADPGRVGREDFLTEAKRIGLAFEPGVLMPYADGAIRQTITLFHARRAPG